MLSLSPLGRIVQVPISEIRDLLIKLFKRWGLPQSIRTDNGEPFGVPTRDVIPIMSLWLVAWGVKPILNRPRQPQENPKVERNQGTLSCWVDVKNCSDARDLQQRLDEAVVDQRDYYPVRRLGNVSRKEVFKDLYTNKRPFEQAVFDEKLAYQYLAKVVYPRKVCSGGSSCIYNKSLQVGLKHRGKTVFFKFDPEQIAWIVLDESQEIIKTIRDERFDRDRLFNLTVCQ
jgi:hypothetical protein